MVPNRPKYQFMREQAADFASFNVLTDVPNLLAWYRADTTTNAGGFVSQLTDKSGNGFHFVQATGSKQPALVASGSDPNGKDCVVFDGTDDALTLASPGFGSTNDITIFLVTRSIVAPGGTARAMAIGNTGDAQSLLLLVPSAGIVRLAGAYNNPGNTTSGRDYDTPAVADATLGTSAVRVLVARHNSAAAASATPTTRSRLGQPIVNNSSSAATISTVAALAAAFGSNKTGTGSYLGYGLYESIVCNALLTDDQVRKIELYLAGYYGLL